MRIFSYLFRPASFGLSLENLSQGKWWVVVTCHLTHRDYTHLFYNLFCLLILVTLIEFKRDWLTIALSIVFSAIAIDSWFIFFYPEQTLIGFSGLVQTLIGIWIAQLFFRKQVCAALVVLACMSLKFRAEAAGHTLFNTISRNLDPLNQKIAFSVHLIGFSMGIAAYFLFKRLKAFLTPFKFF